MSYKHIEKINILLVEDHYIARIGVRTIINNQPDMRLIAEAGNRQQALDLFRQHKPQITLMDIKLPDGNGIEVTESIIKEWPEAKILILSTYSSDEDIYRAMNAGVSGYLLKDIPAEDLLRGIREVHNGKRHFPSAILNQMSKRIAQPNLTAREIEILRLLARGLWDKEIAVELHIAENTAHNHVRNILNKLDARDRTQAVTLALKRGLIALE
jgi:two-component system, NarL family, response regulator